MGGLIGYKFGESAANDYRVKGDEGYSRAGNVGYVVGSAVGSTVTVYGLSTVGGRHSSPCAAFGSALPSLALLTRVGDPYLPLYGIVFYAPAQSLGATLGVNLTLR